MAVDPKILDQYGTPFWVHFDLSTAAGTHDLVTPKPLKTHPSGIAGGSSYELSGIVITGIHYHIHGNANDDGFTLQAVDYQLNTATPTVLTIFSANVHTNDQVSSHSLPCFLPLKRGGLPLPTPAAGVQNGSKVQVTNVNAGGNCQGSLVIEGFHTTHSFGEYADTGSPQVFA